MFTSIAIIGRPNVGKSTLFNKLTKSRQAIVSDFSGLTKDRNYGYISFGDQKSLIIDTGGIAQDDSILKEDIAEQAWIAAEESNLIIFLLDGSQNLNKEDLDILTKLRKLNKNFITVFSIVNVLIRFLTLLPVLVLSFIVSVLFIEYLRSYSS